MAADLPCNGYVRETRTVKGRGVFASRAFEPGEIVEVCPVVLIRGDYKAMPVELRERVFNWTGLCKLKEAVHALALGYGSVYNHANPANLRYEPIPDGPSMRFLAALPICIDQELTINYNGAFGGHISTDDDWFRKTGVVPVP